MPKKYETVTTTKSSDCLRSKGSYSHRCLGSKGSYLDCYSRDTDYCPAINLINAQKCILESSEIKPIKESPSSVTISGNKTTEPEEPTPRQVKQ